MPNPVDTLLNRRIEQLPSETRTKLRSTQILTSIPQIVSELLQNSLDAGARHIEIGVDCEEWTCWVQDDGVGISKEGLDLIGKGSEDGRYVTSKAYNAESLDTLETFGFRGEALASVANLACLEISSRTARSRQSWSVILKGGSNLYNGTSVRWRREKPGTVVCVRDAFYNLPIRRLSHPPSSRTLEQIRREVEAYALVFPSVAFSLENTNPTHSNTQRALKIPQTESPLATFRHLWGRALVENVDEIRESLGDVTLEGFISLHGAHSKYHQFLYVNRHPLSTCDLHRIIEIQFSSSTFMKNAYDEAGKSDASRLKIRRSPRKTEKKPVYILNFAIPPRHVDNCLEPSKTSILLQNKDAVTSLLVSVVRSFLVRHGFLTQDQLNRKRRRNTESPPPCKPRNTDASVQMCASLEASSEGSTPPEERDEYQGPLDIYNDLFVDDDDQELTWRDPKTGEYFIVDKRTGNSYPRDTPVAMQQGDSSTALAEDSQRRTIPILQSDGSFSIGGANENRVSLPEWIQEALQENKAYSRTEPTIRSLSISTQLRMDSQCPTFMNGSRHSCEGPSRLRRPVPTDAELNGFSRQFSKHDLLGAEIINQVDRKFIACLIDESSDPRTCQRSLILIDQHAADERIRVERFLKELCLGFLHQGGLNTRELSPLVAVLLTRYEALRLKDSPDIQAAFRNWGIEFADLPQIAKQDTDEEGMDTDTGNSYVQVSVRRIPDVVSDKLLLGEELRDLVKGFLARLETDTSFTSALSDVRTAATDDGEFDWLKALRWCPRELLELVNSKACRGAIMFNDSLTRDQCEKLVRQLAETAFPFQCAHGRPSLVPLANVGIQNETKERASPIKWARLDPWTSVDVKPGS